MGTIPLAVCQSYRNTAMIKTAAVLLLVVLLGPTETQGEDVLAFKNSQNCHCECECPTPGDNKCLCDCACPRPGSSCGPGFTQVCPSPDGNCPEAYMPLCPEDLLPAGRADVPAVEDRLGFSIKHDVKCGKTKFKCTFKVDIAEDCSAITKVTPSCSPKRRITIANVFLTLCSTWGSWPWGRQPPGAASWGPASVSPGLWSPAPEMGRKRGKP